MDVASRAMARNFSMSCCALPRGLMLPPSKLGFRFGPPPPPMGRGFPPLLRPRCLFFMFWGLFISKAKTFERISPGNDIRLQRVAWAEAPRQHCFLEGMVRSDL